MTRLCKKDFALKSLRVAHTTELEITAGYGRRSSEVAGVLNFSQNKISHQAYAAQVSGIGDSASHTA